jgi:hypothetical protein
MRARRDLNWLLGVLAFAAACHPGPPQRPAAVPEDAVWLEGSKSGAWIQCGGLSAEPPRGYPCTIYHEASGTVWTKGEYLPATWVWDRTTHAVRFEPRAGPFISRPGFESFDGRILYLHGNEVLVPHGWIDSPVSADHGTRTRYDWGKEVEETSY